MRLHPLLTNRYVLYGVALLAGCSGMNWLLTRQWNALIGFALIGFLAHCFSQNMILVLSISLLLTHLLLANRYIREGMESKDDKKGEDAVTKIANIDPQMAQAIPVVQQAESTEQVKQQMEQPQAATNTNSNANTNANTNSNANANANAGQTDVNNMDLNKPSNETNAPVESSVPNSGKGNTKNENFGPRLDYAATIEQSYQNLDEMLGSSSIKQLTTDTQKLMQQQQNLFNTMNQMVPVLEGAQNLLKGFDMSSLTKGLAASLPAPANS